MKKSLPLLSMTFIISTSIIAYQTAFANVTSNPESCPDVAEIQKVKFYVNQSHSNYWSATPGRQYLGTKHCWDVHFNSFVAKDKEDATQKVNKALPTLKFNYGPIKSDWRYTCTYESDLGAVFTVTPTFYDC